LPVDPPLHCRTPQIKEELDIDHSPAINPLPSDFVGPKWIQFDEDISDFMPKDSSSEWKAKDDADTEDDTDDEDYRPEDEEQSDEESQAANHEKCERVPH
jgi:hypothetical protein